MDKLLHEKNPQAQKLLDYLESRHPVLHFMKLHHRIDRKDIEEHLHNDLYQLTYCPTGLGLIRINPWEFNVDDASFYLINPNELHSFHPLDGDYFDSATCRFALPGYAGKLLNNEIKLERAQAMRAFALLCEMQADMLRAQKEDSIRASLRLSQILLMLAGGCAMQRQESLSPLISNVIKYMSENFRTISGIHEVADACQVTTSHLSRAFRKETGVTPLEYLHRTRLGYVLECLFRTRMKISDIASESGFNNTKNLNVVFHRVYNMSPSEYRAAHQEDITPPSLLIR